METEAFIKWEHIGPVLCPKLFSDVMTYHECVRSGVSTLENRTRVQKYRTKYYNPSKTMEYNKVGRPALRWGSPAPRTQAICGHRAKKESENKEESLAEQGQKCIIIFCKKGKYQPRMDKEEQISWNTLSKPFHPQRIPNGNPFLGAADQQRDENSMGEK